MDSDPNGNNIPFKKLLISQAKKNNIVFIRMFGIFLIWKLNYYLLKPKSYVFYGTFIILK